MKKIKTIFVLLFTGMTANILIAGSPLSKVSFYEAYLLNETVQYAENNGVVDGKIAFYLMDENVSLGEKSAVINALTWNEHSKANIDTYKMFLGRKYGVGFEDLALNSLDGSELLCLGYMMLLAENNELSEAILVLNKANEKNTTSYLTHLIQALAEAQLLLNEGQDCEAWKTCNVVKSNTSFTKDINEQAITLIFQEVDEFRTACE